MKKFLVGMLLSDLVFLVLNILTYFIEIAVPQSMKIVIGSVTLTITLLITGFVAGRYIRDRKFGFYHGFLAGVSIYALTIIGILIYLLFFTHSDTGKSFSDVYQPLTQFAGYMIVFLLPVIIISSIVTGVGGYIGSRYPIKIFKGK